METGIILNFDSSLEEKLKWCKDNEIATCQLSVGTDKLTSETAETVSKLCKAYAMRITALVGGWSGPSEWNFTGGPLTLGIVPPAYRAMRLNELKACARFANKLGVRDICSHMGFIPENPSDPLYADFISALRYLLQYYASLDLRLNMETGQETPVSLLRVINDINENNLGINFDPANFLMYGKANPIDALYMLGKYVNGVHAKDGEYPTDGKALGLEKPLGKGRVNIEAFIQALFDIGYNDAITIEREISGEQQMKDILDANRLLRSLILNRGEARQ